MRAMNPGGTILVAEAVLEADKTDLLTRLTDLVLMVDLAGRERNATEFRRLFATAGLALKRIVPTKSNYKIMELEAKIDEQLEQ
ncbi:hypothetical protein KDW_39290 [Dictyobacter vulcani]|uniref:O-methyltransferase C-terminal domain-containing protein n=2 Tax=Dictyobacter vulcani TaxID=2607529 RepID=A0A5J4KTL7_9CHLR|nr:hypothetical protein KDW_39290 [Dictyobacter vulcani]